VGARQATLAGRPATEFRDGKNVCTPCIDAGSHLGVPCFSRFRVRCQITESTVHPILGSEHAYRLRQHGSGRRNRGLIFLRSAAKPLARLSVHRLRVRIAGMATATRLNRPDKNIAFNSLAVCEIPLHAGVAVMQVSLGGAAEAAWSEKRSKRCMS